MFERLVVNASPLILLSGVDGLEWVAGLSDKPVLVPRAVAAEVEAGAGGREIIDTIERDPRFEVVPDVPVPPYIVAWDVGAGESQVIAYCHQQAGAIAVLDDRLARQCASSLNIRVIGTLGILLAAKRRGAVTVVRPVIERLVDRGMFLSSDLIAASLREIGE